MNKTQKKGVLAGAAVMALLLYVVVRGYKPAQDMPTAGGSYYTGPMLRKSGIWVTADGKIVPPPAGWKPSPPPAVDPKAAKFHDD